VPSPSAAVGGRTKIWTCKIGEALPDDVPGGADLPMRESVARTYRRLTGREPDFIFSGWGGELTEPGLWEESRMPDDWPQDKLVERALGPPGAPVNVRLLASVDHAICEADRHGGSRAIAAIETLRAAFDLSDDKEGT
jgi:hypothetical protein